MLQLAPRPGGFSQSPTDYHEFISIVGFLVFLVRRKCETEICL